MNIRKACFMDVKKICFYGLPEVRYGDEVQMTFTIPEDEFVKLYGEKLPQDHFTASYTPSEGVVDVWYTVKCEDGSEPNRLVYTTPHAHRELCEAMEARMRLMENCSCAEFIEQCG